MGAGGTARSGAAWRRIWWEASLYLAVGIGSMFGGLLRWGTSLALTARFGEAFPWGTLAVNVLGSFAIAFYAVLSARGGAAMARPRQYHFVTVGICGGFTTFSLFSLETLTYLQAGDLANAGLYVGLSIPAWLLSCWAGLLLGQRLRP